MNPGKPPARGWILALAAALPLVASAVAPTEGRELLDARWERGGFDARATHLVDLAEGDPAGLRRELRSLRADGITDVAMRDRLITAGVTAMMNRERSAEGRELLAELGTLPVGATTWHEDSGHRAAIPYADPGAAARAVLRSWDRFEARDAGLLALAQGSDLLATLDSAGGQRADVIRGLELAVGAAPAHQLLAQTATVRAALRRDAEFTGIATRLALRTADVELAREVLRQGAGRAQLDLVLQAHQAFDSYAASTIYEAALGTPEAASAAVLALGQQGQRDRLLDLLADPTLGGSAAQALARDADGTTLSALGSVLDRGVDDLATRRAVLALRLTTHPGADAILARFVADDAAPETLRQEVAAWTGN